MSKQFPLSTVAGRTALLISITAGITGPAEVEAAVLKDNEKRPTRRPVCVEGMRFESVTEAAHWLKAARPDLWQNSVAARERDQHRITRNLISRIRNWCNADNVEGYYWDVV